MDERFAKMDERFAKMIEEMQKMRYDINELMAKDQMYKWISARTMKLEEDVDKIKQKLSAS